MSLSLYTGLDLDSILARRHHAVRNRIPLHPMLRFEKIKEFKNLNAISRIIYSERHGMILSIPGGESGMKVHSFATGKLLFQHRFGPNTIMGTTGEFFKIGRWVIIRCSQSRGIRTVYIWVAFP